MVREETGWGRSGVEGCTGHGLVTHAKEFDILTARGGSGC